MENKLKNSQGLEQAAEELLSHLNDQVASSKARQEVLSEIVTNTISQAQPDASAQQSIVENGTPLLNESEELAIGGLAAGIRALYPNLTDEQIEDLLQAI